ncbi:MAG: hypothetical protein H3C47_06770 [Candidatus Cloacimonetes bacterium]|nr:hypothetical protein [Candidatus Cloacimonadota bacterium]
MIFFILIFLSSHAYAYEDMEKWPFCQDLLSEYSPEKIRDDVITDINLMNDVASLEYTDKTIWVKDTIYHRAAVNRVLAIAKMQRTRAEPARTLQDIGHLKDLYVQATLCIAGLTELSNLIEWVGQNSSYYSSLLLIHKDALGTRTDYLDYLWSIRNETWDLSIGQRGIVVRLMQAGLEDKKFFDFVSPGIRSSYIHYIPMLEFFQRSTGLNHETLRQALRHEDYYVFEWAVKKISSQHITDLYSELADAINQLIRVTGRTVPDKSEMRKGKLRLFTQYRYLPFEDEVLVYEYTPHHLHPPPAWNLHPIPPDPKIKEAYQTRKSDKLY